MNSLIDEMEFSETKFLDLLRVSLFYRSSFDFSVSKVFLLSESSFSFLAKDVYDRCLMPRFCNDSQSVFEAVPSWLCSRRRPNTEHRKLLILMSRFSVSQ